MSKLIFRQAILSDVPQLVRLRILMQTEVNSADIKNIPKNFEAIATQYFSESLKDQSYYSAVAECDGSLVSANGLVIYKKPPSFPGVSGIVGYVTNVYTMPEYRKKGISGELMKLLVEYAKAANVSGLHLGATESGKSIYENVGFRPPRHEALELKLS